MHLRLRVLFAIAAFAPSICHAYEFVTDLMGSGTPEGRFGSQISADGGKAIVSTTTGPAAASIYDVATGEKLKELVIGDDFIPPLTSVAIGSGLAVVGAPKSKVSDVIAGAAYLFDSATGSPLLELHANDYSFDMKFGVSVAIDGDVIAVGAPNALSTGGATGAVYLFEKLTGNQLRKIVADDPGDRDYFGQAIAMNDGRLLVGAPDAQGNYDGAAYLFDVSSGEQLQKLVPESEFINDNDFGVSVALDDGIALVGARAHGDLYTMNTGAAYLFDTSTGDQIAKLLAPNPTENSYYASTLALEEGIAVVGSSRYGQSDPFPGAVFVYDATTGTLFDVIGPGHGADSSVGSWVAISDGRALVNAAGSGGYRGVYVYDVVPEPHALLLALAASAPLCSRRR